MNYIAVDFEWNQTYVPKSKRTKEYAIKLDGEIIQIGAVKLDENFEIVDTFEADIRPVFYRKIHKNVKALTGIDQARLNAGRPFGEVMKKFITWCGKDHVFLTWGADDSRIMMQNLLVHKWDTKWMGEWINLQVIYAMQKNPDSKQVSLENAVESFGLPLSLRAHNAYDDAMYTALICKHLDIKSGMKTYHSNAELSGLKRVPCGNYKLIYNCTSKQNAFAHKRLVNLQCPFCNHPLNGLKPWIKQSGNRFITIGSCNEHGLFVGKLKFIHEKDGTYTAKYMMYTADESDEQYYINKLRSNSEKARKKRKKRRQEQKSL